MQKEKKLLLCKNQNKRLSEKKMYLSYLEETKKNHNYLAKAKNIQLANNPTTNSDIPAIKPVTKKNINYNLVCFIVNSGAL